MIVPFPAGGGADILVRMLTKYMSENLSHSIIVQNLPGAGGGLAFGQRRLRDPHAPSPHARDARLRRALA